MEEQERQGGPSLKLEEIILNTRRFASFLLGRSQTLEFVLRPITVKETFEKDAVKEMIIAKSHKELGMNKSTLWYQRRRLMQTGSVRLYNKTRGYFVLGSQKQQLPIAADFIACLVKAASIYKKGLVGRGIKRYKPVFLLQLPCPN